MCYPDDTGALVHLCWELDPDSPIDNLEGESLEEHIRKLIEAQTQ